MAPDRGQDVVKQARMNPEVVSGDSRYPESENLISRPRTRSEARRFQSEHAEEGQNFTIRGVLVGLGVGLIICFSNTYFGLQRQFSILLYTFTLLTASLVVG